MAGAKLLALFCPLQPPPVSFHMHLMMIQTALPQRGTALYHTDQPIPMGCYDCINRLVTCVCKVQPSFQLSCLALFNSTV